jgi:uncharacterized protein YhbP (UPF0306 family)
MKPEAQEFLQGLHVATLATFNPRGSIHLAAVWYLWDPEKETLSVPTGASTRKAKNAKARNEVSIMVDSRAHGRFRGVAATGKATILVGDEARERNALIHCRYITPDGMKHPQFGALHTEADDTTIVLAVERSRWWNLADIFDPELESRCLYRLDE